MHKRCKNNVANNCGINARQLADILNDMGMTPSKLNESAKPAKKKVLTYLPILKEQFVMKGMCIVWHSDINRQRMIVSVLVLQKVYIQNIVS